MACCSLGLFSLTQCGGGSSSNGHAPDTLNGTTVSIQMVAEAGSPFPNIFTLVTSNDGSQSQLETKGSTIALWNGTPTVIYYKTGDNTGTLSLNWIQGTTNTTRCALDIPALEFDSASHANAGANGATATYQPAGEDQVTITSTADVTIFYNN